MADKKDMTVAGLEKRRKIVERFATFGLLLICVALVAPFAYASDLDMLGVYKWIYSAGALIFVMARVVGASDPKGSMRMRRLRRLEFWAGIAFVIGAVLWFYTEKRLDEYAGPLAVMRNTIMFTLAGACIQIIASWLIVAQSKKEQ